MMPAFQTARLYHINVARSSPEQALTEIEELRSSGSPHYVCFMEGNLLSCAVTDAKVREVLQEASLVYPDGTAVARCWGWHYRTKFRRVTGPDTLLNLCRAGQAQHRRHFFLGGAPGVADRLGAKLREQFPELEIAGTFSPPFRTMTEEEEEELARRIAETKPDYLWVALGGPKQEFWMQSHLGKLPVPVMLGVGAAFDFHSGNRPWAPRWVRKLGLEWIFRTFSGGRRTFRRNLRCLSIDSLLLTREFFLSRCPGRRVPKI